MNFQQILYFVTVAQERSFSRAAEILYVTQPAVSRQIAELERELNSQLFFRERHKVTLTPIGEACLPIARKILSGFQQLEHAAGKQGKPRTPLRIGYPNMTALNYLPEELRLLKKEFPDITIDLLHAPAFEETLLALKDGRLDALITSQTFVADESQLQSRLLCTGRLDVILPPDSPLAQKDKLYFHDLTSHKLLIHRLNRTSCAYRVLIEDLRRHGLTEENIQPIEKTDDIFMAAALGKGIALMPGCFLDGRIGNLKAVPLEDSPDYYGAVIAIRKDETDPALTRLLAITADC